MCAHVCVCLLLGVVRTIAGQRLVGSTDGVGTQALFNRPNDVELDPDTQQLYVADTDNNKLRQIDLATGLIAQSLSPLSLGKNICAVYAFAAH